MNLLPCYKLYFIMSRTQGGGSAGVIPIHYKVGTDFYKAVILQYKDLLRVSLGFRGVTRRPDVPLYLDQA
jgi:hypothetical protein